MAREKPFKVIIVGGGPVGLTAAHVFNALKIDYVVLEKGTTTMPEAGAANFLNPFALRIYHQLGLLKAFEDIGTVTNTKINILPDGSHPVVGDLGQLGNLLGYSMLGIDRRDLLKVLTNNLPHADLTIQTGSKVVDVKIHEDFVEAILEDGSSETGSIILGTDGTWSKCRAIVQKAASKTAAIPSEHKQDIKSHMQTLYGRASISSFSGMKMNTFYETHDTDKMTQAGTRNADSMFFGVYKALLTPATEYKRYTEAETQAFAQEFAHIKVLGADGPTFGEIWKNIEWYRLVDQEQGFAGHIHHKRVVLAGDAAVKMTSVAGLGLNYGVQAVTNLGNALYDALQADSSPSTQSLEKAFQLYEQQTSDLAAFSLDLDYRLGRVGMWRSWLAWFMDQWVIPWLGIDGRIEKQFSTTMPPWSRLLKSVSSDGLRSGTVPWSNY